MIASRNGSPVGVGFVLQPDEEHLERTAPLLDLVDYLELAPETTWTLDREGSLHRNGFSRRFEAERARGLPFVAHGVGLSMAGDPTGDEARRAAWLDRVRADHELFHFTWWTDHFGATTLRGPRGPEHVTLPVPLPCDARTEARLEASLDAMQAVVPDVGFENTAFHFAWEGPEHEPWLLRRVLSRGSRRHLLLDLHNLVLNAGCLGYDARRWLATLDLSRVIEIHVAGGALSDPRWLPSGRVFRLDGHDHAVPPEVWQLLAEVLPRCTSLRGVTLERMEGTVTSDADVANLREELATLRTILSAPHEMITWPGPFEEPPAAPPAAFDEAAYATALRASASDDDGQRLTALLVAKLRFERTQRGSALLSRWFDEDPQGFSELFRRYHEAEPISRVFPAAEAEQFLAFAQARSGR